MRNPPLPAGRQSMVAPLREGHVRKGGLNRGPSQIKARPPAPGAIPPRSSVVSARRGDYTKVTYLHGKGERIANVTRRAGS